MLRIIALICLARSSLGLSLNSTNRFYEREIHGTVNTNKLNERILGGSVTSIRLYPYMVSVQLDDNHHHCGGSIISPEFVISAAHCFKLPHRFYTLRMGTSFTNTGGIVHRISEVIKHPGYQKINALTSHNDAILLRLSERITYSETVQPVALQPALEEVPVGTFAVVTGWGFTEEAANVTETTLRKVELPIISFQDCNENYIFLNERTVCAAYQGGGRDACRGDSGGPLVANGKQVGIASTGYGCGLPGYPGIYTKIAVLRNWINRYTGV